jgi:hypothetical protein
MSTAKFCVEHQREALREFDDGRDMPTLYPGWKPDEPPGERIASMCVRRFEDFVKPSAELLQRIRGPEGSKSKKTYILALKKHYGGDQCNIDGCTSKATILTDCSHLLCDRCFDESKICDADNFNGGACNHKIVAGWNTAAGKHIEFVPGLCKKVRKSCIDVKYRSGEE